MEIIVQAGLTNALIATLLAVFIYFFGRFYRCPALIHSLWLLVLLKLITPPLVHLPLLPWPEHNQDRPESAIQDIRLAERLTRNENAGPINADGESIVRAQLLQEIEDIQLAADEAERQRLNRQLLSTGIGCLVFVWLTGSLIWFTTAARRLICFTRLLQYAVPADHELLSRASLLCEALGLRSIPSILLVPGQLAPMLWNLGKSALILPQDLFHNLSLRKQETLLLHELAHWKRGDHRVRWLEILVRGLYWWHPLVWLACREIQEAEEQLCDAWVVNTLPGSEKTYAQTLIETLDFLGSVHPPLPVAASGIGQVDDLKRRLQMIMKRKTSRSLTWLGRTSLLGIGTALLTLGPTWAQTEKIEKDVQTKLNVLRGKDQNGLGTILVTIDESDAKGSLEVRANQLKAELERKRVELAILELDLGLLKAAQEKAQSTNTNMGKKVENHLNEFSFQVEGININLDSKKPEGGKKSAVPNPVPAKAKEILLREINGKWTVIEPHDGIPAHILSDKKEGQPFITIQGLKLSTGQEGKEKQGKAEQPRLEWKIVPDPFNPPTIDGVKKKSADPTRGNAEKKGESAGGGGVGFTIQGDTSGEKQNIGVQVKQGGLILVEDPLGKGKPMEARINMIRIEDLSGGVLGKKTGSSGEIKIENIPPDIRIRVLEKRLADLEAELKKLKKSEK